MKRPVLLYSLVLIALLTLAVTWSDRLAGDARYEVGRVVISSDLEPDDFAADTIQAALSEEFTLDEAFSVFDPDVTLRARHAFESNPWVREVKDVTRRFPGSLHVELEVRRPFACVEREDFFLLVDIDGELLPMAVDEPPQGATVITVRRERRGDLVRRAFSETWFLDAVREGTAVIHDLLDHADADIFDHVGIEAIDVSNFDRRLDRKAPEVALVTDERWRDGDVVRPVMIHWGRSTEHEKGALEVSVTRKLHHLSEVVAERGHLRDLKLVDVRFDRVFWRMPE